MGGKQIDMTMIVFDTQDRCLMVYGDVINFILAMNVFSSCAVRFFCQANIETQWYASRRMPAFSSSTLHRWWKAWRQAAPRRMPWYGRLLDKSLPFLPQFLMHFVWKSAVFQWGPALYLIHVDLLYTGKTWLRDTFKIPQDPFSVELGTFPSEDWEPSANPSWSLSASRMVWRHDLMISWSKRKPFENSFFDASPRKLIPK